MDESGLILLFSSFPCALLLIMLTEMAERQQQALAEATPAPRPSPMPAKTRAAPDAWAWDVGRFFRGPA